MRTIAGLLAVLFATGSAHAGSGRLDPAFGNAGWVETDVRPGAPHDTPFAITVQPDGRIVVAGGGNNEVVEIVRYEADGSLDASFGTRGIVTTAIPGMGFAGALAVVAQPDGKLVVGGFTSPTVNPPSQPFLARYDPNGSLDASFGSAGIVTPGFDGYVERLVLQDDGYILVNGVRAQHAMVARFDTAGALDPSFGTGGVVEETTIGNTRFDQLAVQPDGRILAVTGDDSDEFLTVRYLSDGTRDPSFGTNGVVSTRPLPYQGSNHQGANTVALMADGRIVVGGSTLAFVGPPQAEMRFVLIRYDAAGTLDPTFDGDGILIETSGLPIDGTTGLIVQPDDKIVVLGTVRLGGLSVGLARVLEDGTVDGSFGVAGYVDTPVVSESGATLARDAAGRLLVAIGTRQPVLTQSLIADRFGVVRYFAGTCGDGVTDAGEDCDDGNLTPGDGCDAHCCTADADGDGLCDSLDPCVAAVTIASAKITGNRKSFSFTGEMSLPPPVVAALDPVTNGVRVVLDGALGNTFDVVIPGGAFSSPAGTGWVRHGTRWIWSERQRTLRTGLNKITLTDRSSVQPGLLKLAVKGRGVAYGAYLSAAVPLTGTLVLGPGQCGVASFPGPPPAPACTGSGTMATCR